MAKRMLVDATHPEETRVVVVSGNRVEEFDFETSTKKQLKGNIYLARVTRVEPSLQAAFVEYGGNRHGFLAFSEIHPDYYRIPVADRQALLAEQAREDDDDDDHHGEPRRSSERPALPAATDSGVASLADALDDGSGETHHEAPSGELSPSSEPGNFAAAADNIETVSAPVETQPGETSAAQDISPELAPEASPSAEPAAAAPADGEAPAAPVEGAPAEGTAVEASTALDGEVTPPPPPQAPESIGGDETEEVERRRRHRPVRHYKIQEVIKRRQILLVQVVKEERGTKGAALTTYLSLAGRYCVLMPNTARGGGISRRITSAQDRRRLKQIMEELQVPEGMAVILRTAGMERDNAEIKRDYEYLMRLWDDIRELTMRSVAPCLIYEEGSLVKRAIRDLYSSDIEEILVEGETGHEAARSFMNMLMPDHVDRVRRYDDPAVPLFQRFQVETELDQIHSPTVRLRSGGYIVINQTEALVAIDVNSGRATRERHIEETAFKTNMEAAEEVARQLRLRDLAGLIVIDFIDMEENRNQHAVERRVKDAMRSDRARIQIGRISAFGLLELSRQRLRPSLSEVSSEVCAHCAGTGRVRSTESTVLHVLRGIEEEGMRLRTAEASVVVPTTVALYMLNHKRAALERIEERYGLHVVVTADDALIPPAYRLDRTRPREGAAPVATSRHAASPVRGDAAYSRSTEPALIGGDGEEALAAIDGTGADYRREGRDGGRDGGREHHREGRDHHRERGSRDNREGREGREAQEGREGGGEEGRGRRRRRRRGRRGEERGPQPAAGGFDENTQQAPGGDVPGLTMAPVDGVEKPTSLVPETGEAMAAGQGEARHGDGRGPRGDRGGERGPAGEGDEQGRRRRRRGRRGGRRRHGEGIGPDGQAQPQGADAGTPPMDAPGAPPAQSYAPARPPLIGPGHAIPDDEEPAFRPHARNEGPRGDAPGRIEGPGDAHDWPWNRRNERFPDAPAEALTPPSPFPATPDPEPRTEPAPAAAPRAERSASQAPAASEPPAAEEPKGPPRAGWWKRLTS